MAEIGFGSLIPAGQIPTPRPRPYTGPVYSAQEGNTDFILPAVPMDHPARLARMQEALRSGTIPQATYDDYMAMAKGAR